MFGRAAQRAAMADRAIMRAMFEDHCRIAPRWGEVEAALEAAGRERAGALRDRGMALPGAVEALNSLAATDGVVQSVLTGNIHANARMKLHAFDLDGFLDLEVGAYGADADDRTDLVDVMTAAAGGTGILAVATGAHGVDELAKRAPAWSWKISRTRPHSFPRFRTSRPERPSPMSNWSQRDDFSPAGLSCKCREWRSGSSSSVAADWTMVIPPTPELRRQRRWSS